MKYIIRLSFTFILCLMASNALAFDFPFQGFQPFPEDLSRWYLGNIFGSDLVYGANVPNIKLMGKLFGIFNQVALIMGIILIVYGLVGGALNSASEGKPLGEKWNAVWMPIRIVGGIILLVPKAGTGYCLMQYIIMMLILQGIGVADAIWGKTLDYYEAGGAISTKAAKKELNFTYDNMNYTYSLQTDEPIGGGEYGSQTVSNPDLLRSLLCMEAFNQDPANESRPKRKMYFGTKSDVENVPAYPILMFGDETQYNTQDPLNESRLGSECGSILYVVNQDLKSENDLFKEAERAHVYMNGLMVMAKRLEPLAEEIVKTSDSDDAENFPKFYTDVQRAMQLYVNYIVSYRNTLGPTRNHTYSFELYKQFGWILAGNYYSVLANFREDQEIQEQQFVHPRNDFDYKKPNGNKDTDKFYERGLSFYTKQYFQSSPDPMYAVPGSEYMESIEPTNTSDTVKSPVSRSEAKTLKKEVQKTFEKDETLLQGAAQDRVDEFMKYLTGEGESGLSAQNPIMSAAKYGEMLTSVSIAMMITAGVTWTYLSLKVSYMSGLVPFGLAFRTLIADLLTPLIIALGGFMYAQGAMLGIYIPLIPYVSFLTGVVGFMIGCVEATVAAPIVALGLISPEAKDDIWGRSAPAFMLLLNLMLRPALMIIGLNAAMIILWIMTEILNIGFLTLVGGTFRIESMFGFMTVLTTYTAAFTYLVTEVYSLINVVPAKVLTWIGGQATPSKGAKEALGASKQAVEAGAAATVGGLEASQKADIWRVQEHLGQRSDVANARRNCTTKGGFDALDPAAQAEAIAHEKRNREGGGISDGAKAAQAQAQQAQQGRPQ